MPGSIEEKLEYLGRLTERVLVKLFGDVEGETPNGRLPMIETTQRDHEKRIRSLERMALRWGGALALLGVLVGLVEAVAHVASAVRR